MRAESYQRCEKTFRRASKGQADTIQGTPNFERFELNVERLSLILTAHGRDIVST